MTDAEQMARLREAAEYWSSDAEAALDRIVEERDRAVQEAGKNADRGDWLVYRDEWEALVAERDRLRAALDGLYVAHGCRDGMGDLNPYSTCGECADAREALESGAGDTCGGAA